MKTKLRNNDVRIIKRGERKRQSKEPAEQPTSVDSTIQETTHEAVATVTTWVSELREKQRLEAETAHTFRRLFQEAV